MLSNIMTALFQVVIGVILLKIYHDTIVAKKLLANSRATTNWDGAANALEKLEERLETIQKREIAANEKIWKLEDENRVLKSYIQQLKIRHPNDHPIIPIMTSISPPKIAADSTDDEDDD